jgi:hypothetical protein
MVFYVRIFFKRANNSVDYYVDESMFPFDFNNKMLLKKVVFGDEFADLNDGSNEHNGCKKHCISINLTPNRCENCFNFGNSIHEHECPFGCRRFIKKFHKNPTESDIIVKHIEIDM